MATLAVSFILWFERELKNQPAGIRTHILIWVGSCLLMIVSILVPEIYNSNINDPGRIAAQVVSGVWFLWAGAIMKMWLDTRGLTTAANIWATAAIGLTFWAWLYFAALVVTFIILLNLVFITKFKKYFLSPSRFCVIDIEILKKNCWAERFHHQIQNLPIHIISKNIKESKNNVNIHIVSKIKRDINIFKLKGKIQKITPLEKISISENLRQK